MSKDYKYYSQPFCCINPFYPQRTRSDRRALYVIWRFVLLNSTPPAIFCAFSSIRLLTLSKVLRINFSTIAIQFLLKAILSHFQAEFNYMHIVTLTHGTSNFKEEIEKGLLVLYFFRRKVALQFH